MMQRVLALFFVVLCPALAAAERGLILPFHSEVALEPGQRARIEEQLRQALGAEGIEGLVDTQTAPCAELACVQARLSTVGAEHAIELQLWRSVDGKLSGVSVSIVEPSGARFSEGAEVAGDQDFAAPLAKAVRGAIERLRRGAGPWLEVHGNPPGAAITVDGEAAGLLPGRVKVAGGLHRVAITADGYETLEQTVTVPRNPDALKTIEVALTRAQSRAQSEVSSEASPWNYVIAGVAGAAGVFLAIGPMQSALRDGECARKAVDGTCTRVVTFDAGEGLQLAAAGLLFAGGATMAIWSPIRARVESDGVSAVIAGHF
jgi:hypothetical protein